MDLNTTREAFLAGTVSKAEYIRKMHDFHIRLYEYAAFLKGTDISRIEITDDAVNMTSRSSGISMFCDKSDSRIAPIEILNFGNYEKTYGDLIAALVDPGNCLFDIGANFGWYALSWSKQFPESGIFAFEPIPKTFGYLKRNIALNHASNVQAFNFGFSNEKAERTFYFYSEGSGNASLADLTGRADVEKVHCPVRSLDHFVDEEKLTVDFIKCDVEGAELFVFEGALRTLQEQKPIVFTEMLRKWSAKFGYHPNQIIDFFSNLGYRCFCAQGKHLTEFRRMDDTTEETNFFFLHNEKHAGKMNQFLRV